MVDPKEITEDHKADQEIEMRRQNLKNVIEWFGFDVNSIDIQMKTSPFDEVMGKIHLTVIVDTRVLEPVRADVIFMDLELYEDPLAGDKAMARNILRELFKQEARLENE